MRYVRAFGRFCWDFVVGDDWRIAAGVVAILAIGAVAVGSEAMSGATVTTLVGVGIGTVAMLAITLPARRAARRQRP